MKKPIALLMLAAWLTSIGAQTNSFLPSLGATAYANSNSVSGADLKVDLDDLRVQYGNYEEVEVELTPATPVAEPVKWDVTEFSIPPGLELQDTTESKILVFGKPQFTGKWCFVLSATTGSGLNASRKICFSAEENEELKYPKFLSDRYLGKAIQGESYEDRIKVDREEAKNLTGALIDGALPEGITIEFKDSRSRFVFEGRSNEVQTVLFSLQIRDELGQENNKQFVFEVDEKKEEQKPVSCPAGYYFDDNLGYCVQSNFTRCPDGSYYEPSTQSCVQFPLPPPTVYCSIGYHFDPYLTECVLNAAPRCPHRFEWDVSEGRCVRLPYSCSFGYRYDWFSRECRYVWGTSCGIGQHYDRFLDRCVRDYGHCGWGEYWDRGSDSCRRIRPHCGGNESWDPFRDRCVRHAPKCGAFQFFDPIQNRCVVREFQPRCGFGTHWSPAVRACVANFHPKPMPIPPRPRPGNPGLPGHPGGPGHPRPGNPGNPGGPGHPRPGNPGPVPRPTPAPVIRPTPAPQPPRPVPAPVVRPVPAPQPPRAAPAPQPPRPAPAPAPKPPKPRP